MGIEPDTLEAIQRLYGQPDSEFGRIWERIETEAPRTYLERNVVEGRRLCRRVLLGWLGAVRGRTIVDGGCGRGLLTRALAARGARVTGIELCDRLVGPCRDGAGGASPQFVVGDLVDALPGAGREGPPIDDLLLIEVLEDYPPEAIGPIVAALARASPRRVYLGLRVASAGAGLVSAFGWSGPAAVADPIPILRRIHGGTDLRLSRRESVGVRNYRAALYELLADPQAGVPV